MSTGELVAEIDYPESEEFNVGETDWHMHWTSRLRDILRLRYRGQRVYTGGNLLVYYVEGNPAKFIIPDHFVVLDCDPGPRRIFKIWEEGRTPDTVIEIISRGTSREDRLTRPIIFERLGIREYFLYDPQARYLKPSLQGFRLVDGSYQRIEPVGGVITCQTLGFDLSLDGLDLVLRDCQTGKVLLTGEEAAEQAAAEDKARVAEEKARVAEEKARVAEEKARLAEEKARVAEEKARLAEEKARVAEEKARVAEIAAQAAQDRQRIAELESQIKRLGG